jgi:tetratricopeptide (TPR) repeat protein
MSNGFYKNHSVHGESYYSLLQLTKQYPNSKLTKGFQEYQVVVGEKNYFDRNSEGPNGNPSLRAAHNLTSQMKGLLKFVENYPDHPAANDAAYRIARIYEIQKDEINAIKYYFRANRPDEDDGASLYSRQRLRLIFDHLGSSEKLRGYLKNFANHPLEAHIQYSLAVHLIRENHLDEALSQLQFFHDKYSQSGFKRLHGVFADISFWYGLERQIKEVKKLQDLQSQTKNEKQLYQQASFWFDSEVTISLLAPTFFPIYVPQDWNGDSSIEQYGVNLEYLHDVVRGYAKENIHLRAIPIFREIIRRYPNSDEAEKAKYSIGVCFYSIKIPFLGDSMLSKMHEEFSTPPSELAVREFSELVEKHPRSNLADDALFVSARIRNGNNQKEEAIKLLKTLIKQYPKGDRTIEGINLLKELELLDFD